MSSLRPEDMHCERCGAHTATEQVNFRANIGLLILRWVRRARGAFCTRCAHEACVQMNTINLLGFGGVISMFVTPYYAIANWRQLRRVRASLGLPSPPIDRKQVRRDAASDALGDLLGSFAGERGKAFAAKKVEQLDRHRRGRELPKATARDRADG